MTMDVRSSMDPELAMRFAQLERTIRNVYAKIWGDWYEGLPGATKAGLVIEVRIATSGYSGSADKIYIYVGEWNLEDDISVEDQDWPQWKRDLVHEMLHEWERKALGASSRDGEELWQRHSAKFDGPGHEAAFFTAIMEKAPYFNMTPEEFIASL
jgi:hypothetical protein